MEFTLGFLRTFFVALYLMAPLFIALMIPIITLGQVVGRVEKWSKFDALYWSLITATTVGYGDIKPFKKISKVFAIVIVFIGLMFTGILVAVTISVTTSSFEKHILTAPNLEKLNESLR